MRGRALFPTAVLLLVSSLACGALGDGEGALEQQEKFASRACACPDVACLRKVQEAQATWISEHGDELVAAGLADAERLQAATDKTAGCVERITKKQAAEVTGEAPASSDRKGGKRKGGKRKR